MTPALKRYKPDFAIDKFVTLKRYRVVPLGMAVMAGFV
jgi:hypothetical protein